MTRMQQTAAALSPQSPYDRLSIDESRKHPAFRQQSVDAEASSLAPSWLERLSYIGSDGEDAEDDTESETSTIRGDDAEPGRPPPARRTSISQLTDADRQDAVNILLRSGIPTSQLDRERNRAILWAAETGSAVCVAYCLERWTERAPARRFSITVPQAVASNLSTRDMGLAFARNEHKLDPIHLAARNGHADVVDLLIREAGVSPDADSDIWGTPLHMAAQHGRRQVVRTLLDAGADINRLSSTRHQTALQLAAESANNPTVKLLIEKGALINHGRHHGALHCAAELGNTRLAAMLLDRGATVDALNNSRRTALHLAAREGHAQIAALLVGRGATLNLRDDARGMTPLDHAVRNGHEHVTQLLLEQGVDAMSRDAMGWTPLHLAAQGGHTRLVAILIDYGIPDDVKTNKGKTPMQLAMAEGNTDTVMLLRQRAAGGGGGDSVNVMAGLFEYRNMVRGQSTSMASSTATLVRDAASVRSLRAASLY